MKVHTGDYGKLWLTLPDGTGISQEGAAVAARIPREVLVQFADRGTLHPDAELLYHEPYSPARCRPPRYKLHLPHKKWW